MTDRKPLGLVVGETADLPGSFTKKNGIEVVEFEVEFPEDKTGRNPRENFYKRMRQGEIPKTSQPSVGKYLDAYRKALETFDEIIVITMTSELSGAFDSANRAVRHLAQDQRERVYVSDSRLASIAEGLVC